jgi:putative colanic acid biosynthesis UDP-glucose lipid carrier transferase
MKHSSSSDFHLDFAALIKRIATASTVCISLLVGLWLYEFPLSERYKALLIITALLTLIIFSGSSRVAGDTHRSNWSTLVSIISSWLVLIIILLIIGYVTKTSALFSRRLLLSWTLATPVLIFFTHLLLDATLGRFWQSSGHKRKVVIAGANEHGLMLAKKLQDNRQLGMSLLGFFDDRGEERLGALGSNTILGRLNELPAYARENNIDLIYIALPMRNIQRVTELLNELHDTTTSIYYVPDVFVFDLIQCRTEEIDGVPVIALCETPFQGSRGFVKRLSDIVIALIALIILAPLFLLIAVGIKLTTPGSVIFKQRRYGLDGHEIVVYKFRTMYVSEDSGEIRQATREDTRVTPLGSFLRKYSLDELPQFVNVLQGRMSVVGPRPHAVAHNEEYRKVIKGYMIRHKVSPGVTGLAQVRGYRGETASVGEMQRRVESDLEYLRNWSLGLDLKIIFQTITVIFSDKKAY